MAATTVSSGNPSIDSITTLIDDITGLLTERTVNYANGVVAVAQFDANGVIVSRTLTDPTNSAKWATKSMVYEDGKLAAQTITYDDGVVQTTTYDAGRRLLSTSVDVDDAQSYQWIQRAYDPETGKLLVTRTLTDSGITRIQAGQQGIELESTAIDETFHGGRGEDLFKFVPDSGHDRIAHFTQGQDRLDLTAYGIFTEADLDGKVTVSGRVTTIQLTADDSIELIDIGPLTDEDLVSDGSIDGPAVVAAPDEAVIAENGILPVDVLDNDVLVVGPGGGKVLQIDSASAPAGVTATPDDGLLIVDTGTAFDFLAEGETTTFDVAYTVSDQAGQSDDSILTVTVTGVNDAPEFSAASFLFGPVDDNQAAGAVVGQVSADDVDISDTQYYEFANGTQTSGAFDIDLATGVITTNTELDYETATSHGLDVVVRDRDSGGLSDTAAVNVLVGDLIDTTGPHYSGTLTAPGAATGSMSSDGSYDDTDPSLADYWLLGLTAGQTVSVQVNRMELDFDPSFWIIDGRVDDPNAQFGASLENDDPGAIGFADDEIEVANGPFGDPYLEFTAAADGDFTIIVTNYQSGPDDGGDGFFDYSLIIA